MKRALTPGLYNPYSRGDDRPAKLQRRHSSSTLPISSNRQMKEPNTLQSPSPLSNLHIGIDKLGRNPCVVGSQSKAAIEREREIIEWIPSPSDDWEIMSEPASKRSRSTSTDRGRRRSISPSTTSASSRDTKSYAYKAANYPTMLETKDCFMRRSPAGPVPEDIALCQRLLHQPVDVPREALFEEFFEEFHDALKDRSEARLLIDLHRLLVPSAENLFIQGRQGLKDVIDGYNDPWLKAEPIYGPRPQPDHARGLRLLTFSESQRRKLRVKPGEKSAYAVRDDMYFPYLTAEIKCGHQALEFADRQNMHSMCIALRAIVSLAQEADRPDQVHRRLLGFSISHELEVLRIYGYYPEVSENKIKYYRWLVRQINIWTEEDKWACYRFVENLDCEFLPIHIKRLMHFLEDIPDPQDISFEFYTGHGGGSQSGERSAYSRAPSSQHRGLQPELRSMIQTLQQQLDEQKIREEKLLAQLEEQRVEQKAREEKLLAQLDEHRVEQKAREEKLLAQLDEQRAEQKVREEQQRLREERLLVLLERR